MYNGHDFLSCIKIPATKQAAPKKSEKMEPMDFAADHRDLISTANKVFGEGKWNHTVVHQTLDYVEIIGAKCSVGCVSSIKVQLENGTFHEDIGYYSAEESTKGLSIHNARIGSAVNGLRRTLLSFGDKIERELQLKHKLRRKQINPEQTDDIQKNMLQSSANKQIEEKSNVSVQELIYKKEYEKSSANKQIEEKSNVSVQEPIYKKEYEKSSANKQIEEKSNVSVQEPIYKKKHEKSSANKQIEEKSNVSVQEPIYKEEYENLKSDKNKVTIAEKKTTDANPSSPPSLSSRMIDSQENFQPLLNLEKLITVQNDKIDIKTEENSKQAELSAKEIQRMERKRRQMEKQMEFKKRMKEKEGLVLNNSNKPNPKY